MASWLRLQSNLCRTFPSISLLFIIPVEKVYPLSSPPIEMIDEAIIHPGGFDIVHIAADLCCRRLCPSIIKFEKNSSASPRYKYREQYLAVDH